MPMISHTAAGWSSVIRTMMSSGITSDPHTLWNIHGSVDPGMPPRARSIAMFLRISATPSVEHPAMDVTQPGLERRVRTSEDASSFGDWTLDPIP